MNELDAFAPISVDGLWPPETIIIPVIGIIAVILIVRFGGRFLKLLGSRIGSEAGRASSRIWRLERLK